MSGSAGVRLRGWRRITAALLYIAAALVALATIVFAIGLQEAAARRMRGVGDLTGVALSFTFLLLLVVPFVFLFGLSAAMLRTPADAEPPDGARAPDQRFVYWLARPGTGRRTVAIAMSALSSLAIVTAMIWQLTDIAASATRDHARAHQNFSLPGLLVWDIIVFGLPLLALALLFAALARRLARGRTRPE